MGGVDLDVNAAAVCKNPKFDCDKLDWQIIGDVTGLEY